MKNTQKTMKEIPVIRTPIQRIRALINCSRAHFERSPWGQISEFGIRGNPHFALGILRSGEQIKVHNLIRTSNWSPPQAFSEEWPPILPSRLAISQAARGNQQVTILRKDREPQTGPITRRGLCWYYATIMESMFGGCGLPSAPGFFG